MNLSFSTRHSWPRGSRNEFGARAERLRRAFELVLQRAPTDPELAAATSLMSGQNLFAICRMLMNTNEFLYID